MTEFIQAFKETSYYRSLFDSYEILGIYLLGSRCTGIVDDDSDYDIAILTLNGDDKDVSKHEYLMYKDKKVHWYYCPISTLLKITYNTLKILCSIQLRNLRDDLIIYENPKYSNMLQSLHELKYDISVLGIYRLFEAKKDFISKVIAEGQILEEHYSKYLYHLCVASYYLVNEEPDKDFLRTLKRIKWQPVPDVYKRLTVERLKLYKSYIEQTTLEADIEYEKILEKMGVPSYVH